MAQRGITGAHNCLEGVAGLYKVYHMGAYSREKLVDELGARFEGINVSIKPYPCCRGVHPFADAGLALASKYDIRPTDVESILIQCGEGTYGLLGSPLEFKAKPRNPVDSQFSIVWGVATALARHRVDLGRLHVGRHQEPRHPGPDRQDRRSDRACLRPGRPGHRTGEGDCEDE